MQADCLEHCIGFRRIDHWGEEPLVGASAHRDDGDDGGDGCNREMHGGAYLASCAYQCTSWVRRPVVRDEVLEIFTVGFQEHHTNGPPLATSTSTGTSNNTSN
jgi:hypothetical protein